MQKLIVLTTDGGDREDGSVYYANYLLVTATGSLDFSESVFSDESAEVVDDGEFIEWITNLGYTATLVDTRIVCMEYVEEEDEEYYEEDVEEDDDDNEVPDDFLDQDEDVDYED